MNKRFLALLVAAWSSMAIASSGILTRAESARTAPSASAKPVAQFASGTQVDVIGRKGGWLQVNAHGKTGWVRLLSVRSSAGGSGGADIGGVVGLATQRNNKQVVAVAGLRGLNEEDLKSAHFDAAQLGQLDKFQVSPQQAKAFAAKGKLQARNVAYLNPPPEEKAPASNGWKGTLP
jgi:hypothetical protein